MPAKYFICPDRQQVEIVKCLENGGCRMGKRCATRPYLRLIGFDRKWKGVSPSSAGNGPRLLYLKAVHDYAINPQNRVWAALGTSTHDNLAIDRYTNDVLSEEPLSDEKMKGIPDILDVDENDPGFYVLSDYKTWGSFKIAKAMGIIVEKKDVPILDNNGDPVFLKSGKNKGKPKTKVESKRIIDPGKVEKQSNGKFDVTNGIKRVKDKSVINFYDHLQKEVDEAFHNKYCRKCNKWESWEGRRCTEKFCEVFNYCQEMEAQ